MNITCPTFEGIRQRALHTVEVIRRNSVDLMAKAVAGMLFGIGGGFLYLRQHGDIRGLWVGAVIGAVSGPCVLTPMVDCIHRVISACESCFHRNDSPDSSQISQSQSNRFNFQE